MSLTTTTSTTVGAGTVFRPVHQEIGGFTSDSRASASRSATIRGGTLTTAAEMGAVELARPSALALVPPGTDPDLWRALTPAERGFFAHAPRSESPIYDRRPGASPAAAPAQLRRGIHLDLRA